MRTALVKPYGDSLVDASVSAERLAELGDASSAWPSLDLGPHQLADLELLLCSALAPLRSYMGRACYERVLDEQRLDDGTFWPWPIVLDVPAKLAPRAEPGSTLALRDPEGTMLAALHVTERWTRDRDREQRALIGEGSSAQANAGGSPAHRHDTYVAGELEGLALPTHYDFRLLRTTPEELRSELTKRGWSRVMACDVTRPIHRAGYERLLRASREHETNTVLAAQVGLSDPSDRRHFSLVRCLQALLGRFPRNSAVLTLQPNYPRGNGLRELALRAIVQRNFGCSHLLADPDDAEPTLDWAEAEHVVDRTGVTLVRAPKLGYVKELVDFRALDELEDRTHALSLSERELEARLEEGRRIPSWFSFAEVIAELRRTHPPRSKQGFTVFFTGLSGAGKSTIANVLMVRLLELGDRPVTLLDGDIVRKNLSAELTFSKEHRDANIRRIGFVASKITKNGGIAICAPIAPYESVRREVRELISAEGGFILVHVATSLEICEQRDRKGAYAKARAGIIKQFTGISDPYETPVDADVVLDTVDTTPMQGAQQIVLFLKKRGYMGGDDDLEPMD